MSMLFYTSVSPIPSRTFKSFNDTADMIVMYINNSWILESSPVVDPVSQETAKIVKIIVVIAVCGLMSLFGVGANSVNIIVFATQGFKDSVNVSLCGLAVADLGCVSTMLWMTICQTLSLFENLDVTFDPMSIMYLTAGWPHVCFTRISSAITAFITVERCLCITKPLKIKELITPFRTKIVVISIFVIMFLLFCPTYFVNFLKPVVTLPRNRTILSLVYGNNRVIVETVTFAIHSVTITIVSLLTVIICTIILVFKLNEKSKWRQISTSKQEEISRKDKKVVKMITLIAIIFIICYTPATINFFLMAYEPRFSHGGQYNYLFLVVWSFTCFVQIINFTINIFIYFKMSSKFQATLIQLMC